jgi:hypothetical protein
MSQPLQGLQEAMSMCFLDQFFQISSLGLAEVILRYDELRVLRYSYDPGAVSIKPSWFLVKSSSGYITRLPYYD